MFNLRQAAAGACLAIASLSLPAGCSREENSKPVENAPSSAPIDDEPVVIKADLLKDSLRQMLLEDHNSKPVENAPSSAPIDDEPVVIKADLLKDNLKQMLFEDHIRNGLKLVDSHYSLKEKLLIADLQDAAPERRDDINVLFDASKLRLDQYKEGLPEQIALLIPNKKDTILNELDQRSEDLSKERAKLESMIVEDLDGGGFHKERLLAVAALRLEGVERKLEIIVQAREIVERAGVVTKPAQEHQLDSDSRNRLVLPNRDANR